MVCILLFNDYLKRDLNGFYLLNNDLVFLHIYIYIVFLCGFEWFLVRGSYIVHDCYVVFICCFDFFLNVVFPYK